VTSAALPMWISRQLASQLAQGQIRLDFRRNKEKEKKGRMVKKTRSNCLTTIFTKARFRMLVLRSALFGMLKMQFSP
jgi:hypothetical protein